MATLADELLNDFEDSGSENEAEAQNGDGFLDGDDSLPTNGVSFRSGEADVAMDEDAVDDKDKVTMNDDALRELEDEGDEEEAKAKVEKMQLGGVSDVRSVAGLMKTLEPVLQVSPLFFPSHLFLEAQGLHHSCLRSLISCFCPENRPLPISTTRKANDSHWLYRR